VILFFTYLLYHDIEKELSSMKNGKKNLSFHTKLFHWYKLHARKLPWRETSSPYKIWISEIMLQQTTVQAVIPYYILWLELFPDIKTLSQASLQRVLKAWQGLGYYKRAKNLHKSAKLIMECCEGQIPQDYEVLKKLPGFGPYTTSAVLSFAFNRHHIVIDANVRRIVMRLMNLSSEADPKKDKELKQHLVTYAPSRGTSLFNQAMMELGALVCRPKNPLCLLCPIIDFCSAYKKGTQEVIPKPRKRKYKRIETVIGIIKDRERYLIQKRPSAGLLGDLWEFPGGKKKKGETLRNALQREIREELKAEIDVGKFLTKVQHSYTQFQVTLYAYECSLKSQPNFLKDTHRWSTLRGFRKYPFPSGSVKIIRYLEERNIKPRRMTPHA
jgi:A/G-specific adenine glycosylase